MAGVERNPWAGVALLSSEILGERVVDRMRRHPPPYRAEFAGKGDERDWPWMIVGADGLNMMGALFQKHTALTATGWMNAAAHQGGRKDG